MRHASFNLAVVAAFKLQRLSDGKLPDCRYWLVCYNHHSTLILCHKPLGLFVKTCNCRPKFIIICPIAIVYSMGQIIKSFCVCPCVCVSVCGDSHGRIFLPNWTQTCKPPKVRTSSLGANIAHPFPHFSPKKTNFGAWIGVFKPNSRNRKTCILSKLLHRFQLNFAKW